VTACEALKSGGEAGCPEKKSAMSLGQAFPKVLSKADVICRRHAVGGGGCPVNGNSVEDTAVVYSQQCRSIQTTSGIDIMTIAPIQTEVTFSAQSVPEKQAAGTGKSRQVNAGSPSASTIVEIKSGRELMISRRWEVNNPNYDPLCMSRFERDGYNGKEFAFLKLTKIGNWFPNCTNMRVQWN
jgi:hypothetical protein